MASTAKRLFDCHLRKVVQAIAIAKVVNSLKRTVKRSNPPLKTSASPSSASTQADASPQ